MGAMGYRGMGHMGNGVQGGMGHMANEAHRGKVVQGVWGT